MSRDTGEILCHAEKCRLQDSCAYGCYNLPLPTGGQLEYIVCPVGCILSVFAVGISQCTELSFSLILGDDEWPSAKDGHHQAANNEEAAVITVAVLERPFRGKGL